MSLLAALAPRAAAQDDPTLVVGSAAPPLVIEQWPRGVPVTRFERGRVYVVEFWATWCTPCHLVVPKLTELQRNNPALTVIGVAASEQATTVNRDDRLEKVQDYIFKRSDEIGYTVAYDGSGETWRRWMVAAHRGGIPAAFIVGPDGRLTWIGNPLVPDFEKELASTLARPDVNKTPAPTRFTSAALRDTQLPPRTWKAPTVTPQTASPSVSPSVTPTRRDPPSRASAAPRAPQRREIRIEFVPEPGSSSAPQRTQAATRLPLPELEQLAITPSPKPPPKPTTKPALSTAKPQAAATKPAERRPVSIKKAAAPSPKPILKTASKSTPKPSSKPTRKSSSAPRQARPRSAPMPITHATIPA
jgi:thiol-disulfide isomerase/thioredoxin